MRELKFRAWNGERMMFRELFDRNWYTSSSDSGKCVRGAMPNDKRTIKVMQSTGRKDENGVDIYEGDVIEASGENYAEIMFNFGTFLLRHVNHKGNNGISISDVATDRYKIIGNIHQNPELIKGLS